MARLLSTMFIPIVIASCACGGGGSVETPEPSATAPDPDAPVLAEGVWPSFRGLRASGLAVAAELPETWDGVDGTNIAWRAAIPGLGHSAPTVWGDRVFATTAVGDEEFPYLKIGLYGSSPDNPEPEEHDYRVYCFGLATGELLWQRTAVKAVPRVGRHVKASHANCTPATDGRYVAAFFGSQGLYLYTVDGDLVWSRDLGFLDAGAFNAPEIQWGFGSSPVIHDDRVIVLCDVNNQSFIAAFDLESGDEVWRTDRDEVPTWGTPTVIEYRGRTQVIVNGFRHLGAYDFDTGEPIWWMKGGGDIPVPTPVVAHGLVFLTNSHGPSRPILAIRLSAEGDVSLAEGETSNAGVAWSVPRRGAYMPTPIVVGDELYVLNDNGILSCYDAHTGERHYRERLGGERGAYTASPVSANGLIYLTEEHGTVHVIEAGREYRYVRACELGDPSLSSPAIAGDTMLWRTSRELFAIRAGGATPKPEFLTAPTAPSEAEVAEPIELPKGAVSDPVLVLRLADQQSGDVRAIRYGVEMKPTGEAAQFVGTVTAEITAAAGTAGEEGRYRIDAQVRLPGEERDRHVVAGTDGNRYYLIDHEAGKVHVDFDSGVFGVYAPSLLNAMVAEFTVDSPFGAEIEAEATELRGDREVDGEACYEVFVRYRSQPKAEAVWQISQRRFLPLGRIDAFVMQGGAEGGLEKRLHKVVVDPRFDEESFAVRVPEGFEEVEEPAAP